MRIRLIAVLLSALVACTNTPNATPPPGTPTITSSTPADGATGIAVDANLTVTFSKPMNTASITVTASPATDLGASIWSDGDTTLTLDPPANLAPGTAYTLSLEGKDKSDKALEGAKTITFTTATAADPPPATPNNPSAKPGDASVMVSWDANTEADLNDYTVFWGTSPSTLTSSVIVDKTQTSKTINGLANGTPYFFAVSAEDTAGNASAGTAPLTATPVKPPPGDTTPPAVPKDLDSSNSDGELTLSWTANLEPDLKGYNIYLGTTTDSLAFAGFVDKASTKKKLAGLKNGTVYYFALDAEDTSGNKSVRTATLHDTPTDRIAPTLVSSAPADGAKDVSVNTDFVFKFSEPMRTDSLEFNQLCAVSGPCLIFNLPVWSDGDRTATLKLAKVLDPNRGYTLTLSAKDKAGNALAPTPIRFTTTGPKLVSSVPANGAKDVIVNLESVTFNFSVPMQENSLQLNCTFVANANSTQCGAAGSGYFDTPTWSNDDQTATFARKSGAFVPSTSYRLEIISAKDKAGNALADTAVTFDTAEIPRPKLVSSTPANGAVNVPLDTDFVFTFNVPMQKDSVHFGQTCPTDVICPTFGSPIWSNADQTLSLKLTQAMTGGTDFSLSVFGNDRAGNALDATVVHFTTIGPKLVSSTPLNGAKNASLNTDLVFTFSRPIQKDSFKLRYKCLLGATCPGFELPVWSNGDQTVSLKSKQPLETCKTYAFSLSAKDTAGRELPTTSVSFTTEPPPGSQCS
jgi:methionine-rich copper-binding protein CopC